MNKASRREHLEDIKDEKRTLVFYEAPHKLITTLKDMLDTFGNRNIALCKELTKLHETVIHTTFEGALETFAQTPPKGEYVMIIEGAKEEKVEYSLESALALANKLISEGRSTSSAAKEAAEITGLKKGDIYKAILAEANQN